MPDMINPELMNGKKQHIVWKDEICASCKSAESSCPLIQVLHSHTIMTHSGVHVSNCDLYDPDEKSEYYIPPGADMEKIARANIEALHQQVDLLNDILERSHVYPQ